MATEYSSITAEQADLIKNAPLFFVASAEPSLQQQDNGCGQVNLSPKGGVPLHILDESHVAYLDYQGSGNETARAATLGGPMTIMVCSFDEKDAAVWRPTEENTMLDTKGQSKATSNGGYLAEYLPTRTPIPTMTSSPTASRTQLGSWACRSSKYAAPLTASRLKYQNSNTMRKSQRFG